MENILLKCGNLMTLRDVCIFYFSSIKGIRILTIHWKCWKGRNTWVTWGGETENFICWKKVKVDLVAFWRFQPVRRIVSLKVDTRDYKFGMCGWCENNPQTSPFSWPTWEDRIQSMTTSWSHFRIDDDTRMHIWWGDARKLSNDSKYFKARVVIDRPNWS